MSGDDGCGQELANWYAMLKKSAIATAKRPPVGAKKGPRKSTLTVADLPRECGTVLTAGGFEPIPADVDIMPRAMLKAIASKEAGPPPPRLDAAALNALFGGSEPGMPLPDRNPAR